MENNVYVSAIKEEINIRHMSCPKILYILHTRIHFVFSYALCRTSTLINTFQNGKSWLKNLYIYYLYI